MDYKYTSIILGKTDSGETDRIYTLYTLETGKLRVLAKGVRKPNAKLAGNLEPITEAEIFVAKSKGLGKITGSISLRNFSRIKGELELLQPVFTVFKIIKKNIADQQKDEKIFTLIDEYLESLENIKDIKDEKIFTLGFYFKFLSEMGYRLEVNKCVHCEKKLKRENNYFSVSRGGILCENCQSNEKNKLKITNESIKTIRIILANKIGSLVKLKISDAEINNLKLIAKNSLDWLGA